MSKRRNSHNDQYVHYNSTGLSKKQYFANTTNSVEELENPTISKICQILMKIDKLKSDLNIYSTNQYKEKALILSEKFPETNNINMLKYTNQLIEIPLNINNEKESLKLNYYENFPFVREPMSIGSDINYFIENVNSFINFKKIILKNARLKIIPESMVMKSKNDINDYLFSVNCLIYSSDNKYISTFITSDILISSNILFENANLWKLIFYIIQNDENISLDKQKLLICEFIDNLYQCFELMENIELGVTVNRNHDIHITNILHNYYTR